MSLAERIEERRTLKGWTQAELARRVGVKSTSIWKLASGQSQSSKHLHKIASSLDTSVEYLLGETDDASPLRSNVRIPEPFPDEDVVELPEIDLSYGMGSTYLDLPVSAEKRQFSRAWLRNFTHASPDRLFWASGDGDSMEPTIRSGETILIDTSQDAVRTSGSIWAVAVGDTGMIRRLHVPAKGRLQLISDNSHIPPTDVAQDELHVIGRVIAVVRRL